MTTHLSPYASLKENQLQAAFEAIVNALTAAAEKGENVSSFAHELTEITRERGRRTMLTAFYESLSDSDLTQVLDDQGEALQQSVSAPNRKAMEVEMELIFNVCTRRFGEC